MKNNNKYQRGKIYKLVDNTSDKVYIGSTCEPILARRLAIHVSQYRAYSSNGRKTNYVSSFEILKNMDYDIILIENFPCNSKDELLARERFYSDTLECVNKNRPGIFNELGQTEYFKNYYQNYHEQIKKKTAKYYKDHIDNIKKNANKKNICFICYCQYTTTNKSRHVKSQTHQNMISLNEILSKHETRMQIMEQIIFETDKFIEASEKFLSDLKMSTQ